MALPGLLIEYLVVGAMALLWLFPMMEVPFQAAAPLTQAVMITPVVYVLGMFIDALAYMITSKFPIKKYSLKALLKGYVLRKDEFENVRKNAGNIFLGESGASSKGLISVYTKKPELVSELNSRSSRDRIARGAFVNILLLWITSKLLGPTEVDFLDSIAHSNWMIISIFSLIVWGFLEIHSYSFELRIGEVLREGGSTEHDILENFPEAETYSS
ncbi:hypothetical protein [Microbulbifer yueqingensis]|uniref:Uncharacterized protein n=1 Tax=Microbulbifer yueqingensis TaxID=658219 RepID=A0A1G9EK23_9GAMM|nr:hypothetical protein [Microbulbifer yueqingensis]SDK76418.1 hypothetical protein SAMN05216212_3162 [Microbulbifer yueqingensis]